MDTGFYVAGACTKGETLFLKDQGGGQGLRSWGGMLHVACFFRATGEEFCLPPLPIDDLGTIIQPTKASGPSRPSPFQGPWRTTPPPLATGRGAAQS